MRKTAEETAAGAPGTAFECSFREKQPNNTGPGYRM
jgi:hypothetical protein